MHILLLSEPGGGLPHWAMEMGIYYGILEPWTSRSLLDVSFYSFLACLAWMLMVQNPSERNSPKNDPSPLHTDAF